METNNDIYICIDCYYELNNKENEFITDEKKEIVKESVKLLNNYYLVSIHDFSKNPDFEDAGWEKSSLLFCDCCGEVCFGYRIGYRIIGKIN